MKLSKILDQLEMDFKNYGQMYAWQSLAVNGTADTLIAALREATIIAEANVCKDGMCCRPSCERATAWLRRWNED